VSFNFADADSGVVGGNQPPVVDPVGDKTIDELTPISFAVTATDPDGDGYTFAMVGTPEGATFNETTGQFDWTPTELQDGLYQVSVTATDDAAGPATSDPVDFTITVNEVNSPPVLDPIGDRQVDELQNLAFTVAASDPDVVGGIPNELTLTAEEVAARGLPEGAAFEPATGQFDWTPDPAQQGQYQILFSVSDGVSRATDSETITITVEDSINTAPVAIPQIDVIVNQGDSALIELEATDAENDPLQLFLVDQPAGADPLELDSGTNTVLYTPNAGFAGGDSFSFKASDGRLESAVAEVNVYVVSEEGWLVRLATDTGDFPASFFGAEPGAVNDAGYDPDYDELYPGAREAKRTGRNLAVLYRPDGGGSPTTGYQRDVRLLDGDYVWVLQLIAYEQELTVAWDEGDLPRTPIRIVECDVDGNPIVSGDNGQLMTDLQRLTVTPADGERFYRIH
jgi:hypothetical protein